MMMMMIIWKKGLSTNLVDRTYIFIKKIVTGIRCCLREKINWLTSYICMKLESAWIKFFSVCVCFTKLTDTINGHEWYWNLIHTKQEYVCFEIRNLWFGWIQYMDFHKINLYICWVYVYVTHLHPKERKWEWEVLTTSQRIWL